jgi:flagella basal body P-ring formation protein FlgA
VPVPVLDGLSRAAAVPGARVEVLEWQPSLPAACAVDRAAPSRPLAGSGRVAVRLSGSRPGGEPCEGWGWARVRLFAPALVSARAVQAGEPLAGSVATEEREVLAGRAPLAALPAGAAADRALRAGQTIEPRDLRTGPRPGEAVSVVVRLGSLEVEQPGHAVPCTRGRACAVVPSGRRVEGTWRDGRLVVESP